MEIGKKLEQYGVLIVGLLIGGGFAFGGIASYSGIVGGGSGSSGGQQREPPQLPESNVAEGGFNLSVREQVALAYQHDVVFVTVLEGNRSVELDRQEIVSDFKGRVYVTSVDGEDSVLADTHDLGELPKAVVISAGVRNGRLVPRSAAAEPTRQDVTSAVCRVMRNWGSAAARCTGA